MSYNYLLTRDFLQETSLEEINAHVNGYRYGPMTNDRKVINITVRAKSLQTNSFFFEKIDPICVLNLEGPKGTREYARTEVCWNSMKPFWIKPFTLDVYPDTEERLSFEIYDIVCPIRLLDKQKLIGVATVELATLLKTNYLELDLYSVSQSGKDGNLCVGKLEVQYYEIQSDVCGSNIFKINIEQIHSPRRTFKAASPFFVIQRMNEKTTKFMNVYKSSVKEHTNNSEWPFVELNLQAICGGDLDLPLKFILYDNLLKRGQNKIGFLVTTMRTMIQQRNFLLVSKDHGSHVAKFTVDLVKSIDSMRFFDYTVKGIKIQPILAIDFSSTKIDNVYTNKLQHIDDGQFSYYGAISEVYDSIYSITQAQSFIEYGFGENLNRVHDKVITLNKANIDNVSIESVLNAYKSARTKVMYPKNALLDPVIEKAVNEAKEQWNKDKTISLLIILTNGKFIDLQNAVDRLVKEENAPLMTLFVLMDGMRNDLNHYFNTRNGFLVDSYGNKASRKQTHIAIFHDEKVYPDHKLALRIIPYIEQMAVSILKNTELNEPPENNDTYFTFHL
ncbi:hypothetical protein TRFO_20013 [Tritrichomonas foetus]|uniref:C2 domain-containing protein n=1 Tax=Tritrichomonas foetus TaxID=1144522 RepID=A0A1J4KGZ2_9EUKA|nr:hypothetical protein TRFO_20013 [Tritrichomonas foetus]|eukprot:OHT10609.1 hypothetical protein TRFO_20013 [Tritrichomonas foetus]